MMHRLGLTLLGTTLLVGPFFLSDPAFAQATPEGAAALQKGLAAILTPGLDAVGIGQPVYEGQWTVEPAGQGYQVTGPALVLALRADEGDRKRLVRIHCEGERYTATPTGATWRLHGDTPVLCDIQPSGGEAPVTVTSRSRSIDMTLDLDRSLLLDLADQSDGVVIAAGGAQPLAVDRLRLTAATTPRAGSAHQDLAVQVEAEGLHGGDGADVTIALDQARYSVKLEDVDTVALRERVWRLLAFALDAAQRDPKAPPRPNVERKVETLLRQVVAEAGSGGQTEWVLTGLHSTAPDVVTDLDSLTVTSGYHGLDINAPGPGLGAAVTVELKGLKAAAPPNTQARDQPDIAIGRLRLAGALEPAPAGTGSSLSYGVDLDGLAVKVADEDVDVGLANGHYAGRLDGVDVAGIADTMQMLQGMIASHPTGEPSPEELDALFGQATKILAGLSGAQLDIGLGGLHVAAPDAVTDLDSLTIASGFHGLDINAPSPGLGAAVTVALKGLKVGAPPNAPAGDQPDVAIGGLRLAGTLAPAPAGTGSSLSYGADLDGLAVKVAAEDVDVGLANGHYAGGLDGINVAGIVDTAQMLRGMIARHPTGEPSPVEIDELLGQAMKVVTGLSGYKVDIGFDGLHVAAPDVKVAFDHVGFGESYQGLDRDDGTGQVTASLKALAIDPPPPLADWIPRNGDIVLSLKDVPYRSIIAALWSGVVDTIDSGKSGEEGELAFAKAMGGVLGKSDASLTVDTFHITAPQGAIQLGGAVRANPAATFGVTAKATLRLAGFDALIKALQAQPGEDGAGAAAGLTMFQVMGRQAKAEDGLAARDYDIVVDPSGKMLINGTDFSSFAPKPPQ